MEETLILVAFVVLVLSTIGFYYANYKAKKEYTNQLAIYEEGVDCGISSIKDLYEHFLKAQNLGIINVKLDGTGIVTVVRNEYEHNFFLENGHVKLKYPIDDAPLIGRGMISAIRQVKLHKKIQSIIDGNELMDYLVMLSESYSTEKLSHTKDYKNIFKWKKLMKASLLMLIVSTCMLLIGIEISSNSDFISYVQDKKVWDRSEATIGEVVNFYLPNAEWNFFTSDIGKFIVEVSGIHQNKEIEGITTVIIQFQFQNVAKKGDINMLTDVSLAYMEVSGNVCSKEEALENMDIMFEIYKIYHSQ